MESQYRLPNASWEWLADSDQCGYVSRYHVHVACSNFGFRLARSGYVPGCTPQKNSRCSHCRSVAFPTSNLCPLTGTRVPGVPGVPYSGRIMAYMQSKQDFSGKSQN
eukprot:3543713-Rhodomonas_salina.3